MEDEGGIMELDIKDTLIGNKDAIQADGIKPGEYVELNFWMKPKECIRRNLKYSLSSQSLCWSRISNPQPT